MQAKLRLDVQQHEAFHMSHEAPYTPMQTTVRRRMMYQNQYSVPRCKSKCQHDRLHCCLRKQADALKEALPKPPLNGKGAKGAGGGTTLISCLKKGMEREILAEAAP